MKLLLASIIAISFCLPLRAQVLINEVVHTNLNTIADEDGDYPDWLELYNNSASTINLQNYRITDDSNNPNKWIFPSVSMNGHSRLLIFLSGKNRTAPNLHTNFKMSLGETLQLRNASSVIQDSITITFLEPGHSRARIPDGGSMCYSDSLTPNAPNGGTCYPGYSATPTFGLAPGFYQNTQSVAITGTNVRYQTDGGQVTIASPPYSTPLSITASSSVRAKSFEAGKLPSPTATADYFVNEPTQLPVVAITAQPGDLFNGYGGPGAYDNAPWGGGLPKVPCYVAYYDKAKNLKFADNASFEVVGNWSTTFAQKSMQFIFSEEWGAQSDMPNDIFKKDKPWIGSFHGFRVRNLDDDFFYAQMRDVIANRMSKGTYSGWAAYQDVAVFINGVYWGHMAAREMLNADYCHENYGANMDDMDLLKTRYGNPDPLEADVGTAADFSNLLGFITTNSMTDTANYDSVKTRLDIDNYVDYFANEIFNENEDWYPSYFYNNTEFFCSRNPTVKWKYVQWDQSEGMYDCTVNLLYNAINDPNNSPHSHIFNAFLTNTKFKDYFINRFADLLNTNYSVNSVLKLLSADSAEIDHEIPAEYLRWGADWPYAPDYYSWLSYVNNLRGFYSCRVQNQRDQIQGQFGLPGQVDVTIKVNPIGGGLIKISSITPDSANLPWTGIYFEGVPVTLSAIPSPGYEFSNWDVNPFIADTSQIMFTDSIDSNTTFTANFNIIPIDTTPVDTTPVDTNTLVREPGKNGWKIFPNPSKGIFEINSPAQLEYRVTDVLGEEISSGKLSRGSNILNLLAYPTGIYFLQLPEQPQWRAIKLVRVE